MGNELVPQEVSGDLVNFEDVTSGGDYLQRLQLFGSKTDACTEGRIGIGRWGLVNDDVITDLGEEVDLVILAYRAKALDTGGETIITDFDARSETFLKIRAQSYVRDSGCMFGPEFLVFIPSVELFATYFASSKTARRESKKMKPLIGCAAIFKAKLIDPPNSKWKWHGPVVLPNSAPMELPDMEIIQAEVKKFKNPPVNDVEVVKDGEETGRER